MTDGTTDGTTDAFDAFEARGWEQCAETYGDFVGTITGRVVDPLLDAVGAGPGRRLLDVATGHGDAAARAARRGADVIGVDVAPAMLRLARQRHPDLDFRLADARSLPFPAGFFDLVVGNFVVLHLGQPEPAIAELVRVLRPGGRLALTTWDTPDRTRLLGVLLEAMADAAAPPAELPPGPPFFRFADEAAFTTLLAGAGLTDVDVVTVGFDHLAPSADVVWDGLLAGTVRTAALMASQSDDVRRRVRASFDRGISAYRVAGGDGFALPVSVKLATGRRP